eukprot:4067807-Ditylum_brightwellii.AAC.1
MDILQDYLSKHKIDLDRLPEKKAKITLDNKPSRPQYCLQNHSNPSSFCEEDYAQYFDKCGCLYGVKCVTCKKGIYLEDDKPVLICKNVTIG